MKHFPRAESDRDVISGLSQENPGMFDFSLFAVAILEGRRRSEFLATPQLSSLGSKGKPEP
jgi:hypothetical protein